MNFQQTTITGCYIIEIDRQSDERGFFARSFCEPQFEHHGLNARVVQSGISWNQKCATLRGMHYQAAPHAECKLVRCTRGRAFDVALDLRHQSPTFLQWHSVELSARSYRMHFVPEGVAHGFLTLEDDTELLYQMSAAFDPAWARGVRWDDPAFAINWPMPPLVISNRDQSFPFFSMSQEMEHSVR